MSASYDPTLPTASDRMRLAVGDTTVDPVESALLADETYTALATTHGEQEGTARAAEALATRYAQKPGSVQIGTLTVSWADRAKTWLALAANLRKQVADTTAATVSEGRVVTTLRPGETDRSEYRRPEGVRW